MNLLSYLLAILMGLVLGVIGGGGSILTVPILVYGLGVSATHATGYSLFIVGVSSFIATIQYARRNLVDFKVGTFFSVPALTGVYGVRKFLIPYIPNHLFSVGSLDVTKGTFILSIFAMVMILAALSMIKPVAVDLKDKKDGPKGFWKVPFEGVFVGALTGLVGAGGGFMIIPALVLLAGLEMKLAVGTSLFIITIKSLIGFIGDIQALPYIDWSLILIFSTFSIMGIFAGTFLSNKLDSHRLKPIFGWFVLIMGSAMLIKELVI